MYQIIIIGAGPAGLSAGLRAKELNLNFLILEKGKIAQTFLSAYTNGKEVTDFPKTLEKKGNFWFEKCRVEELITRWKKIAKSLNIKENQEILKIQKEKGKFLIQTQKEKYESQSVIIAIGKQEKPRKLGIVGEDLEKVFYHLKDSQDFNQKKILVVGGGDSAIEAALSLSEKNSVTISYRKENFFRLNEENLREINKKENKIKIIFKSNLKEIKKHEVILDIDSQEKRIENDFVFIFAGSELFINFFKKIGVKTNDKSVILDENFQSSFEELYVVGDAAQKVPFLIKPAINQGFDIVNIIAKKILKNK